MSAGDLVVVFGGSGFIGKQVVRALANAVARVRIAMRRPHLGAELRVMGDVGQVQLVQANVRFPKSIDAALEDADAVMNLVSTMYEGGNQTFETLNVDAAQAIAEAAAKRGIQPHRPDVGAWRRAQRLALCAQQISRRTRGARAAPTATILRPSVVFGPEDNFFNRFGAHGPQSVAVRHAGGLPLIGGGKTKFQPIFVGDVADAVVRRARQARGARPHL